MLKQTTGQDIAQHIMDKNYLGVETALRAFNVQMSDTDLDVLKTLKEIPFSESVLNTHKDTHILVAVLPLSIIDIQSRVDPRLFFKGWKSCFERASAPWCNDWQFAHESGVVQWMLIRKNDVPGSRNKLWSEQVELISPDEEIPNARVLLYTSILNYLHTGELLFRDCRVRTSDMHGEQRHIFIGSPDGEWISCCDFLNNQRSNGVGLASAIKPN